MRNENSEIDPFVPNSTVIEFRPNKRQNAAVDSTETIFLLQSGLDENNSYKIETGELQNRWVELQGSTTGI